MHTRELIANIQDLYRISFTVFIRKLGYRADVTLTAEGAMLRAIASQFDMEIKAICIQVLLFCKGRILVWAV